MASILVTGGTGFIGRHLIRRLIRERHRVAVLSRFPPAGFSGSVTCRRGFFGDPDVLKDIAQPVDGIFHLAAAGTNSPDLRQINVDGTRTLAEWAGNAGIPFFFYAGSIDAQGPAEDFGRKQTADNPCRPLGAYGESKRDGEREIIRIYGEAGGEQKAVIARIGNVYGPESRAFIGPMLQARLMGPASHRFRSLDDVHLQPIFAADLVRAMVRSFETGLQGTHYFVGQETCTISGWFQAVCDLVGDRIADDRVPASGSENGMIEDLRTYFAGDGIRRQRLYDESQLYQRLGIDCRTTILRGTAETIAWLITVA